MQRLTKIQIEHLSTRIDTLLGDIAAKRKAAIGPAPSLLEYTFEEKLDLIRKKKATLKSDVSQHTYLQYCFDYPVSAKQLRARAMRKAWDTKIAAVDAFVRAEKTRLLDNAILGDSETALQAVQALERRVAAE